MIAPPKEVTETGVVDDFDIEEEEVAIQHRWVIKYLCLLVGIIYSNLG